MIKSDRHRKIIDLVKSEIIETQEELTSRLAQNGFDVTQATVSRDIKELRLLKVLGEHGGYKDATVERAEKGMNDRFIRMLSECVISVDSVGNLIVIKTLTASANAACEAIDSMKWDEVLGTIAGDNTLLVIARSEEAVEAMTARLHELIKK